MFGHLIFNWDAHKRIASVEMGNGYFSIEYLIIEAMVKSHRKAVITMFTNKKTLVIFTSV
jgi:hypothetical protein